MTISLEKKEKLVRALLLHVEGIVRSHLAWIEVQEIDILEDQHQMKRFNDFSAEEIRSVIESHIKRLVEAGVAREQANNYANMALKLADTIGASEISKVDAYIDELLRMMPVSNWAN